MHLSLFIEGKFLFFGKIEYICTRFLTHIKSNFINVKLINGKFKNIQPVDNFDWEAYENGTSENQESREAQAKAYENKLNSIAEHEVVEGTVIAIGKEKLLLILVINRMALSLLMSFVIIQNLK